MSRLEDLHRSFARHLRAEGRSDRTGTIYGQSVTQFSRWLEEHGREPVLAELNRAAIREWLADLAGIREPSTVRMRHKGLRRFCGWLIEEGEIEKNPMAGLRVPSASNKPVPVLTDDELTALLKACQGKDFRDRRDEAIVRVLLDCGVRVSELTGMTVEGLDLDAEMIVVRGKGNKLRPVYFGARTARALDRYLRVRPSQRWAHSPALFLSQRGPLSPDGVREALHVRGTVAGIKDLHPHRFRHTFAHQWLVNGGQERDLKRLAGWSSDVMLERYGASAADARARGAAKKMKLGDRV